MPKINPFQPQYPPGAEPPPAGPGKGRQAARAARTARARIATARKQGSKALVDKILGPEDPGETDE